MSCGKRSTTAKYIEKAINKHGERYDYSKVVYTHSMESLEIICREHGPFNIMASSHLSGKGCQKCGRDKTKGTTEEFLTKAKEIYGDRFDYSHTVYVNLRTKLEIICRKHGPFSLKPYAHLTGNGGCRVCSGNKPLSTTEFVDKAKVVHLNAYDYTKTTYKSARTKVIVICKDHGEFLVTASEHLKGSGCIKCVHKANTLTTENFIQRSIEKHGNLYDYSLVDYRFSDQKVKIVCHKHGLFEQIASSHMFGSGCPKCSHRVSKKETRWLDQLSIAKEHRQKTLTMISGKRYQVDAYDLTTNTVYEFNGDFWHGNPQKYNQNTLNEIIGVSFGELFQNTQSKLRELIENGYNVVSIWESDFRKN